MAPGWSIPYGMASPGVKKWKLHSLQHKRDNITSGYTNKGSMIAWVQKTVQDYGTVL